MQCTCPKLYTGKTVQQLRRRISAHLSTINTGVDNPLSRHADDGYIKTPTFWAICHVKLGPQKVNLIRNWMQEEVQWIYRLNCWSLKFLNEGFTFSAFLRIVLNNKKQINTDDKMTKINKHRCPIFILFIICINWLQN